MNDLLMVLAVNSVPIACAIFAGVMEYNENEGWGAFLLIALLTIQIPSFK